MDNVELTSFKIIAAVGEAKTSFLKAIDYEKNGKSDLAIELIEKGEEKYKEAHSYHFELLQKSVTNKENVITLLLAHAEDQLLSVETIKLITKQFISIYKEINKIKEEVSR